MAYDWMVPSFIMNSPFFLISDTKQTMWIATIHFTKNEKKSSPTFHWYLKRCMFVCPSKFITLLVCLQEMLSIETNHWICKKNEQICMSWHTWITWTSKYILLYALHCIISLFQASISEYSCLCILLRLLLFDKSCIFEILCTSCWYANTKLN